MTTTENTETASTPPTGNRSYLDLMSGLTLAQQARAMEDLEADRCLLRRDMKARQNTQYDLPQDTLPECSEDDMGVQVGDNTDNSKVVHNHYHSTPDPNHPPPHPPVHGRRWPWWLIAALVLPWIVLATGLVWWLVANWDGGDSAQPVIWQLDIGAENPGPQPAGEVE